MTLVSTSAGPARRRGAFGRLSSLAGALLRGRGPRVTAREIAHLDDHLLRDIGLSPADVVRHRRTPPSSFSGLVG